MKDIEHRILLCADLDRTLLPNGARPESPEARPLLRRLAERPELELVYVTGRDRDLIRDAIREYDLPLPDRVVGDVGATIYAVSADGDEIRFAPSEEWKTAIGGDWNDMDREDLAGLFGDIGGIRLQEPEKQGEFKLSYYAEPDREPEEIKAEMERRMEAREVRANLIWSIDEEKNLGLLDVLPRSADKLRAIRFLMERRGYGEDETVFAGDSGNDLAPLTGGLSAVLVANAAEEVRRAAREAVAAKGRSDRLYLARGDFMGMNGNYAAGVLEGLCHFHPRVRGWLESGR